MTTSAITAYVQSYDAGSQLGVFTASGSTPDVGAVYAGHAAWWVTRSGEVIKTAQGMQFSHLCDVDGDTVHLLYVDVEGNAGSLASYTFDLAGAFAREQYVAAAGNNANDGSSGSPVQTIAQAITNVRSGWSAGDEARIHLAAGETFDMTGVGAGSLFVPDIVGRITVVKWGEGDNPLIQLAASGNGVSLITGSAGELGISLIDVDVAGTYTAAGAAPSNYLCSLSANDGDGINFTMLRCTVSKMHSAFIGPGDGGAATFAHRGDYDFLGVQSCTIEELYEYPLFGFFWGRYWGWRDNSITDVGYNSNNGYIRTAALAMSAFVDNTFDRSGGGSTANILRLIGGKGSDVGSDKDDYAHHLTLSGNSLIGCTEGFELDCQGAATDDWHYMRDVDVIGNRASFSDVGILVDWSPGGSQTGELERLIIRNNQWCSAGWRAMVNLHQAGSDGTRRCRSVWIEHNTAVRRTGGTVFGNDPILFYQTGTVAYFSTGCITVRNNYCYSNISSGTELIYRCGSSWSDADTIIGVSDYNVWVKAGGSANWELGQSLASWRSNTTHDDNSSSSISSTHNLTDITLSGFDARPTASPGTGLAGVCYVDADFHLYDDTSPSVGAFQYGTTTEPDGPLGGGGGDPSSPVTGMSGRLRLALGL